MKSRHDIMQRQPSTAANHQVTNQAQTHSHMPLHSSTAFKSTTTPPNHFLPQLLSINNRPTKINNMCEWTTYLYPCGHAYTIPHSTACPGPGSGVCRSAYTGTRRLVYPCARCNPPRTAGIHGLYRTGLGRTGSELTRTGSKRRRTDSGPGRTETGLGRMATGSSWTGSGPSRTDSGPSGMDSGPSTTGSKRRRTDSGPSRTDGTGSEAGGGPASGPKSNPIQKNVATSWGVPIPDYTAQLDDAYASPRWG
jgi:hypothetical protein